MEILKLIFHSTIGKAVGTIVGVSAVLAAVWAIDDRYVTTNEMTSSEARIISEVRSESAETRVILIEDMESRLDEFDFDISMLEADGQVIPESLGIKRNMLDRRIQRLKQNETNNHNNNN